MNGSSDDMQERMRRSVADMARMSSALQASIPHIATIAARLLETVQRECKVLTCGNGGSAAESLHLAEELVGRFQRDRRAISAISLCADATALTCIANDWDYAEVFARQVDAHGRKGDLLFALSTSGKSASIIRALERARSRGVTTIGLLGQQGSPAESHCDLALTWNDFPAARIQEAHLAVIHLLLEQVDAELK